MALTTVAVPDAMVTFEFGLPVTVYASGGASVLK